MGAGGCWACRPEASEQVEAWPLPLPPPEKMAESEPRRCHQLLEAEEVVLLRSAAGLPSFALLLALAAPGLPLGAEPARAVALTAASAVAVLAFLLPLEKMAEKEVRLSLQLPGVGAEWQPSFLQSFVGMTLQEWSSAFLPWKSVVVQPAKMAGREFLCNRQLPAVVNEGLRGLRPSLSRSESLVLPPAPSMPRPKYTEEREARRRRQLPATCEVIGR